MIRVVIADDHTVVRTGLRELLATADDIELVASAANGAEAIDVVAAHGPDVVLIAVSGYGQDADRRRSLAEGLAAHVTKPIDLEAIHRLLTERLGS